MSAEKAQGPGEQPKRLCKVLFCRDPKNCAVLEMIKASPNQEDLNYTFTVIAPRCSLADETQLINEYNKKTAEFNKKS